jgi:hypothetical protein
VHYQIEGVAKFGGEVDVREERRMRESEKKDSAEGVHRKGRMSTS